uniref:Uncharacterized protein n=1 Tax=Rhabditophanes sp. KR3021 TaxID=114890 RepID=A0AC35TVM7_9BILA
MPKQPPPPLPYCLAQKEGEARWLGVDQNLDGEIKSNRPLNHPHYEGPQTWYEEPGLTDNSCRLRTPTRSAINHHHSTLIKRENIQQPKNTLQKSIFQTQINLIKSTTTEPFKRLAKPDLLIKTLTLLWQAFFFISLISNVHTEGVTYDRNDINDNNHNRVSSQSSFSTSTQFINGQELFLRHRRLGKEQQKMCQIWTKECPKELCSREPLDRLELIRDISLFSSDLPNGTTNVELFELFRLDWSKLKSKHGMLSAIEHLKEGDSGKDCLVGLGSKCQKCFEQIDTKLNQVVNAYNTFNKMLHRFDCMPAIDSASATRPFSPNGTCELCKTWYRKWLLVQIMDIWVEPICINWCYYAQLACPHFATSKVVDYAGHPTFQCRDTNIPLVVKKQKQSTGLIQVKNPSSDTTLCKCLHPCDLEPESNYLHEEGKHLKNLTFLYKNQNKRQNIQNHHDVFFSQEFCSIRKRKCDLERKRHAINNLPNTKPKPGSNQKMPSKGINSSNNRQPLTVFVTILSTLTLIRFLTF